MNAAKMRFILFNLARNAYRTAQYALKQINPNYSPKSGSLFIGGGGTNNAGYCKGVWQTHIEAYKRFASPITPLRVAEFGPGNTIGSGLCALLDGACEYYAFDAYSYSDNDGALALLDKLIKLCDYDKNRSDRIVRVLNGEKDEAIKINYVAPWENTATLPKADFIFSQAVLEHVDNLKKFYEAQAQILDRGGLCSHQIDFRSHGETFEWNGHWAISLNRWRKIRYIRPYSINREPLSTHLKLLKQNGFEILNIQTVADKKLISIDRRRLAPEFANLSDEDFTTSSALIVARKA
ncbi:MAG: class I SAM-dependent methyltransferase [Helicobacteraceae bacterium]|jgi:SAM-dependent methyltransferase|nr:class I SAM-dependent methyltransferase [Helicobacteraceae bacterium]